MKILHHYLHHQHVCLRLSETAVSTSSTHVRAHPPETGVITTKRLATLALLATLAPAWLAWRTAPRPAAQDAVRRRGRGEVRRDEDPPRKKGGQPHSSGRRGVGRQSLLPARGRGRDDTCPLGARGRDDGAAREGVGGVHYVAGDEPLGAGGGGQGVCGGGGAGRRGPSLRSLFNPSPKNTACSALFGLGALRVSASRWCSLHPACVFLDLFPGTRQPA